LISLSTVKGIKIAYIKAASDAQALLKEEPCETKFRPPRATIPRDKPGPEQA
jgi:hypothetical protein